jgi:hypothetical protein
MVCKKVTDVGGAETFIKLDNATSIVRLGESTRIRFNIAVLRQT